LAWPQSQKKFSTADYFLLQAPKISVSWPESGPQQFVVGYADECVSLPPVYNISSISSMENSMAIQIAPHQPSPPIKIALPPPPPPTPQAEPLAVSKREAARLLSVCERTLDYWRKDGRIASVKVGNRVLFPMESLRNFLSGATTSTDG